MKQISSNCNFLTSDEVSGVVSLNLEEQRTLSFLLPLSSDYPDIDTWFLNKVVPGSRSGTRRILHIERDGLLVAVGIAKKEEDENKICTVRVDQRYFGRGIGVRIFGDLMDWLGDDRPVLTVSEFNLSSFQRIFDHFGYMATSAKPNLYRLGSTEFGFNEKNILHVAKN